MTIADVRFRRGTDFFTAGVCTVTGVMEDGSEVKLFEYYIDELSFTSDEIIGKTVDEARTLKVKKDIEYLKS